MNVIEFPAVFRDRPRPWLPGELRHLLTLFAAHEVSSAASIWEIGATEIGDPQFCIIGPGPDFTCLLCISRLGRAYILEDGRGAVLLETTDLQDLVNEAARVTSRAGPGLITRAILLIAAMRLATEQRLEVAFEEATELVTRLAPQVIALA
jgi:hypothetical protein